MAPGDEQAREGKDEAQAGEAMERQSASPDVVHEAIRLEGDEELSRGTPALAWSALAAGLAMGLSFVAMAALRSALPPAPWRHLVASLGYTVGFVFVVTGRQQLFTENTLTPVLPVLDDRSKLPNMLRLWGVVLAANLVGALLFAWVLARTPVVMPELHASLREIAEEALAPSAGTMLLRAVFAGWLIALMVWMLPGAESARLAVIVLPTYLISVLHFGHSIAGSVDVFYLIAAGGASLADYGRFIAPTLVGNIVGGVTLVALLNHAQVRADGSK